MSEPKKCPFCGGEDVKAAELDRGFWVHCNDCDIVCADYSAEYQQDVIDKWNRRAVDREARNAVIEECAKVAETLDDEEGSMIQLTEPCFSSAIRALKDSPAQEGATE